MKEEELKDAKTYPTREHELVHTYSNGKELVASVFQTKNAESISTLTFGLLNRSRKATTFDYYTEETQKVKLPKDFDTVSIRTDITGLEIGNEAPMIFF